MFGVSYWLRDGWFVSLYGLEKSSPYELAFGVELGPKSISLHSFTPESRNWKQIYLS